MLWVTSEDGFDRWVGALLLQNYRSIPEVEAAFLGLASDPDQRVRAVASRTDKATATEAGRK
jgi:hypothetical protein